MIIPNIWENKSHVPNHQPDLLESMAPKTPKPRLFPITNALILQNGTNVVGIDTRLAVSTTCATSIW